MADQVWIDEEMAIELIEKTEWGLGVAPKFKVSRMAFLGIDEPFLPSWRTDLRVVSIHEMRRRLSALRRLNLSTAKMSQVVQRLQRIIDGFPMSLVTVEMSGLFRARATQNDIAFGNVAELWAPPPEKVVLRGRLNDVGVSRFYCASQAHTAVLETRPKTNGYFTLLICSAKTGKVNLPGIFLGLERSASEEMTDAQPIAKRILEARARSMGPGNFKKYRLVDTMIGDLITEIIDDDASFRYLPTIALAHLMLDKVGGPSVVGYPSCTTEHKGVCMVMRPEVASEHFVGTEAWQFAMVGELEVDGEAKPLLASRPIRRSEFISADGSISWLPDGKGIAPADIQKVVPVRNLIVR